MQKAFKILEFDKIIERLEAYCYTEKAKKRVRNLEPYLQEMKVLRELQDTTEAKKIIETVGNPPMTTMKEMTQMVGIAEKGGMLLASQLESISSILYSFKKLKEFLNRSKKMEMSLAYYADEIIELEELRELIQSSIRDGWIEDYASSELKNIRRSIRILEDRIKDKVESMLKVNQEYYSDLFVVNRSGHTCLPVKKEYKAKVNGVVIDKSQTGSTFYIEPAVISSMNIELQKFKIEEDEEERKILYTLSAMVAEEATTFEKNGKIIESLDFCFAKARLSIEFDGIEPKVNTNRNLKIVKGRHPLLEKEKCVPLDFELNSPRKGVIITGPNTGGKTVALKTIGLLSCMAQCGLHIPAIEADIAMNNQIFCDIGDGQNMLESLSTFSAHIINILDILKEVSQESLVLLDELGSGTDPAEGMGIAISILEELKKKGCTFIVTTHYPEVKIYAEKQENVINARMAFDRETLKPLYRLEIGKAGESCALYIAKHLGMPEHMLKRAAKEAYGLETQEEDEKVGRKNSTISKIEKKKEAKSSEKKIRNFQIGDSVIVFPEKKIGIICRKANEKGEYVVQIQKQKRWINQKRLKLNVAASELYPEDYDFSIIFDSVENRKARHQMEKGHRPDLKVEIEKELE